MLSQGHAPKIETKNKPGVTALREIAAGESRHGDAAQGAGLDPHQAPQRAPRRKVGRPLALLVRRGAAREKRAKFRP
jgi:hypothetical protein